jgi:undecaprenyl-diphosphatase
MSIFEAIILGLVQGLTEFLPISSSAHLRVVGEFLPSRSDPGAAFTAITQIGTEAAVVLYFWRDISRIVRAWFGALLGRLPQTDPDVRIGWWIILGSLPIVVLGLAFQDQIETTFRSLWFVAISLIVFGIVLGLADHFGKKTRTIETLTWKHGLVFGLAQAMALIPGVSRSGGTITAGLLMGYRRADAARYSFLLAIPAVFGSGFFQLAKSFDQLTSNEGSAGASWLGTIVATVVAFFVALGVIAFLMNWLSKRSFLPFVLYRIALGALLIVLLSFGVLSPEGGS